MCKEKSQADCCEGYCFQIKPTEEGLTLCIRAENAEKLEALKTKFRDCCKTDDSCCT
jgi:hypothetical protein